MLIAVYLNLASYLAVLGVILALCVLAMRVFKRPTRLCHRCGREVVLGHPRCPRCGYRFTD